MRACSIALFLMCMVGSVAATPQTKTHPDGFTLEVPDGWQFAEADAPKPLVGKLWAIVAPGSNRTPVRCC